MALFLSQLLSNPSSLHGLLHRIFCDLVNQKDKLSIYVVLFKLKRYFKGKAKPSSFPSGLFLASSPSMSTIQILFLASCTDVPSACIAFTVKSAIPIAASPAPRKRNLLSDKRLFVIRRDAKRPATATDAVPWMSSLNVQYWSRYLSKKRKALWFPKSSNYMKIDESITTLYAILLAEAILQIHIL